MTRSRTESGEAPARGRRHRPRDETKSVILQAATRLAISRVDANGQGVHNPLAGIRITDVLNEVNRVSDDTVKPMTTGAFYQIWADQSAFQGELMGHVLTQVANYGVEELEAFAFELVASGMPADAVLREVVEAGFTATQNSPGLFLAIGLGALAPVDLIRRTQQESKDLYVESLSRLLTNLLRYAGRELRADVAMADLVWSIEAITVGYALRGRTDPEIPVSPDGDGITARTRATVGVIEAFTRAI